MSGLLTWIDVSNRKLGNVGGYDLKELLAAN